MREGGGWGGVGKEGEKVGFISCHSTSGAQASVVESKGPAVYLKPFFLKSAAAWPRLQLWLPGDGGDPGVNRALSQTGRKKLAGSPG